MGMRVRPPFRADHVGSLLRPKSLLHLRERWKTGKADLRELRAHEDLCIAEVVKIQEELGLNAVTDGEFRRESFHVDFIGKIKNVTSSWDFDAAVKLGEEDKAGENISPTIGTGRGAETKRGYPPKGRLGVDVGNL